MSDKNLYDDKGKTGPKKDTTSTRRDATRTTMDLRDKLPTDPTTTTATKTMKDAKYYWDNYNVTPTSDMNLYDFKGVYLDHEPGANEDQEGLPFVGRAGQLLDKMLSAIDLDRKKVYISNIINFRPPENRRPTDEEIERYLPFIIA